MSEPFTCACGRRTRAPFMWHAELLCALCMEQIRPEIVNARERADYRASRLDQTYQRSRWGRQLA